jgi:hypothetical protein
MLHLFSLEYESSLRTDYGNNYRKINNQKKSSKKGTDCSVPFLLFLIQKLLEAISDSSSYWEA